MSLKETNLSNAVLATIDAAVTAARKNLRQDTLDELRQFYGNTGSKQMDVLLPDGTKAGLIYLTFPKPTPEVTDRNAFTDWVRENYPSEVEHIVRVRPAFEKTLLDDAAKEGQPVAPLNRETGEAPVMPGVEVKQPPPEPKSFTVRPDKEAIAQAWARGDIDPISYLPGPAAIEGGQ